MRKAIAATLAALVVLLALPLGAAVVVSMGVGAATECVADPAVVPPTDSTPVDQPDGSAPAVPTACQRAGAAVTVASFNLLGAAHTDRHDGGGSTANNFPTWDERLPRALAALTAAGVDIAALQEVHPPQAKALARHHADTWDMFPRHGQVQNRVIWDRTAWTLTSARLIPIPYFGGKDVGTPLVELRSATTGQSVWMWGVHNPADTRGSAAGLRAEALRRQLATLSELATTGTPGVLAGDFNDAHDGPESSHCQLTPTLSNAFGGTSDPCVPPASGAAVDHIYGVNLAWTSPRVDTTVQAQRVSDHPLVVATATSTTSMITSTACTAMHDRHGSGPVQPQFARLVVALAPLFGVERVGGVRGTVRDKDGHPFGLAADFMVPITAAGQLHGSALAEHARSHAARLGVDDIIWRQRIWSLARSDEGWRPMEDSGSPAENHRDLVRMSVLPTTDPLNDAASHGTSDAVRVEGLVPAAAACGNVVYPVPPAYITADRHNWHDAGPSWSSWHTGTDFSMPCGTPVLAAHAGTIEVDTTQSWAGPYLVKITTGPASLATWYAHMETVTISRGQSVEPGEQIGTTGALGNARGCHLHFEVHEHNGSIYGPDNVDPSLWLSQHADPVSPPTGLPSPPLSGQPSRSLIGPPT